MTSFANNLRDNFSLAATEASFEGDKDALAIYESLERTIEQNIDEDADLLVKRLRTMLISEVKCEACPYKHAAYSEALTLLDETAVTYQAL